MGKKWLVFGKTGKAVFGSPWHVVFMPPLSQFKRLDVRGMLDKGIEPFSAIRKRVNSLAPDQGLMLIAPFLPSPLVEKLGSEGFKSRIQRGNGGEWVVYFWKEETE